MKVRPPHSSGGRPPEGEIGSAAYPRRAGVVAGPRRVFGATYCSGAEAQHRLREEAVGDPFDEILAAQGIAPALWNRVDAVVRPGQLTINRRDDVRVSA